MEKFLENVNVECPECGAKTVEKREEKLHAIFGDGNGAEYTSQYLFCPKCGARFVTGEMMDENLRRAREAKEAQETEMPVPRKIKKLVVKQFEKKGGKEMRKIILPEHADMQGTKVCHECHGAMIPCTEDKTYCIQDEEICIVGIKCWKCTECGEIVYSSGEAKLIEDALKPYMPQKGESA